MQYSGSHPSMIEPVELIKNSNDEDVLIAYSLGNYIASFNYENSEIEMVLNMTISKSADSNKAIIQSADYVPIYVLDNGTQSENRFELKDMKKLAIDYEDGNNETISRKEYDKIIEKLRWINELIIK